MAFSFECILVVFKGNNVKINRFMRIQVHITEEVAVGSLHTDRHTHAQSQAVE